MSREQSIDLKIRRLAEQLATERDCFNSPNNRAKIVQLNPFGKLTIIDEYGDKKHVIDVYDGSRVIEEMFAPTGGAFRPTAIVGKYGERLSIFVYDDYPSQEQKMAILICAGRIMSNWIEADTMIFTNWNDQPFADIADDNLRIATCLVHGGYHQYEYDADVQAIRLSSLQEVVGHYIQRMPYLNTIGERYELSNRLKALSRNSLFFDKRLDCYLETVFEPIWDPVGPE